jgi:hypothetical protein
MRSSAYSAPILTSALVLPNCSTAAVKRPVIWLCRPSWT